MDDVGALARERGKVRDGRDREVQGFRAPVRGGDCRLLDGPAVPLRGVALLRAQAILEEREQRRLKHKAKFLSRPQSSEPKARPMSGLPSSPTSLRREEIRAEVESGNGTVGDVHAADMQKSLSLTPLVPLHRPTGEQDDKNTQKNYEGASLSQSKAPFGSTMVEARADTASTSASQAASKSSIHSKIKLLLILI